MGKSTITLQVQNFDSLMRQVQQLKDGGKKAIKNTVNDMKARAPGWISDEVRKQYNIKKSEIMPAKKGEGGKAANIRVSGESHFPLRYELHSPPLELESSHLGRQAVQPG